MDDRTAVRVALQVAIEYEESFIKSYPRGSKDEAVKVAERRINAFKRVLKKRYDVEVTDPFKNVPSISIYDIPSAE